MISVSVQTEPFSLDAASAQLLASAVAAGFRITSFARAASDLEELFLQVTAPDPLLLQVPA